jgi:hypothetical protein
MATINKPAEPVTSKPNSDGKTPTPHADPGERTVTPATKLDVKADASGRTPTPHATPEIPYDSDPRVQRVTANADLSGKTTTPTATPPTTQVGPLLEKCKSCGRRRPYDPVDFASNVPADKLDVKPDASGKLVTPTATPPAAGELQRKPCKGCGGRTFRVMGVVPAATPLSATPNTSGKLPAGPSTQATDLGLSVPAAGAPVPVNTDGKSPTPHSSPDQHAPATG